MESQQWQDQAVTVVGCGLIGRSWAIAFARAGFEVRLFDTDSAAAQAARAGIGDELPLLERNALLGKRTADEVLASIRVCHSLDEATRDTLHVQENAPETREVKRRVFAELDHHAPAAATIASSSSALLPSTFMDDLPGAHRCLVAHPLNPPHLVPAVELVPGPDTAGEVIERADALFRHIGQQTIVLAREIEGFVMNRLQGALLEEAFRLIDAKLVSAADIDTALKHGLGLRWSFMGPVETIDLNAPGGVLDFIDRYGEAYRTIAEASGPRLEWQGRLAERLHAERRETLAEQDMPARRAWRDRRLMALAVHKRSLDGAEPA